MVPPGVLTEMSTLFLCAHVHYGVFSFSICIFLTIVVIPTPNIFVSI